ncbi:FdrA family protein [Nocardioides sp. CFH 31398]|uniref:FdrA family protein n=1 Tax=Nocardioides sp. CFH 31398 TaxID=2919579 RepID=UPI001F05FC52|nr:FdrA family protein [Nocardioides sp. CFH 31398]MCH1865931.1 FdrA family protein [Nocardioides sp. CFH 31398]
MSTTHVELRPGAYADSVALLQVSRAVQALPGVASAQVAMATGLNVEVLSGMGFEVPAHAGPNDMVVALRLDGDGDLDAALAGVAAALADAGRRGSTSAELAPHRTTAAALREVPPGEDAVVLVSVPGPSAVVEAVDAIEAGCDVMVFSDNVPLADEVALKRAAAERGVLVMGPDCGTAVVGGVGLGFANVVAPGPVGVVAASGTGAQQVLALLDHAGVGVTHAYGVGGRDLSAEVGALATREALRRLDAEPGVERVLLVSKPPAEAVAADVGALADSLATPVATAFLGAGHPDLTAATETLLGDLGVAVPDWPVAGTARPPHPGRGRAVRGLFVGGTLCTEARLVVEGLLGADGGHLFTDFGDDEYTSGRAHPMIDPTLRTEEVVRAAADPAIGVLLLDVVLGHGAEPDPAASLAPVLAGLEVPVVVTVVGTAGDPQDHAHQVRALTETGAEVHLSNAGAARRAAELAGAADHPTRLTQESAR